MAKKIGNAIACTIIAVIIILVLIRLYIYVADHTEITRVEAAISTACNIDADIKIGDIAEPGYVSLPFQSGDAIGMITCYGSSEWVCNCSLK